MSTEQQECLPEIQAEEWGERLTKARENLSLSIDQVAADLNLPIAYIKKLEACSLEGLPSLVFAKGYIRAYAKLLRLDDSLLVEEFEVIHGEGGKGQIRPVSRVRQQVKMNDPVMKLSSWIFILAIIGVSVWWWQTQYGGSLGGETSQDNTNLLQPVPDAQQDNSVVAIENGTSQLVLPKLDDQPVSDTVEDQTAADEQPEAEPEYLTAAEIKKLQTAIEQKEAQTTEGAKPVSESQTTPTTSVVDLSEVNFSASFIAECWVSIKDANGKTLFNNLRGKGQSLNVTGKPPLNILIGAADAVSSVSYNGKAINLDPHTRKNIVRLTLPVAE